MVSAFHDSCDRFTLPVKEAVIDGETRRLEVLSGIELVTKNISIMQQAMNHSSALFVLAGRTINQHREEESQANPLLAEIINEIEKANAALIEKGRMSAEAGALGSAAGKSCQIVIERAGAMADIATNLIAQTENLIMETGVLSDSIRALIRRQV